MGEALQILNEPEQIAVLGTQLRLRMLEHLSVPQSATSLAVLLDLPRQQVNYHLRELERVGLVEFVEERRKGNCMERLFKCSAEAFVVAPSALGELRASPEKIQDQQSSDYLASIGARLIDDVSHLRQQSGAVPTLTIEADIAFESDETRGAFARELAVALASLAEKYHSTNGQTAFRLVTFSHPIAMETKS
ncbi:MAG: helix-turn-helix transcriptional regulator [Fimbriimonadaceae bacterium]|nr:helix-turn-helix transcriptional regulator [Fimbriimonadaceae bacterium]